MHETIKIEKLVYGGQGLGTLSDGRKIFVWNALPGEKAVVTILKQKHSYAEGIATDILGPSNKRVVPKDTHYLATSPWQILDFTAENEYKGEITKELFTQHNIVLPDTAVIHTDQSFNYRNKMEYSFWGDEEGLHLALHDRGSHRKAIVHGSSLALPAIDKAAQAMIDILNEYQVRAGDLKTMILRCSQDGKTAVSLFSKSEEFTSLKLPPSIKGLRVYYSNPKSPASVPTKLLYSLGDVVLEDRLLDKQFEYDVDSFFQVNIPIFEEALKKIKPHCDVPRIIDMYAGVGSIGLSVAQQQAVLVELDPASARMARKNISLSKVRAEIIETSAERALEYISQDIPIIFDPPRAGLHEKIITRIQEVHPPRIIYLSCNPSTQARDIEKMMGDYKLKDFVVFNFFPRTPHIETLAVLELQKNS